VVSQILHQLWIISLSLNYARRDRERRQQLDRRLKSLKDSDPDMTTFQVP
jgi:hypothetical protein